MRISHGMILAEHLTVVASLLASDVIKAIEICAEPNIDELQRKIPNLFENSLDPTFLNLPRFEQIVKRKNGYMYPFGQIFSTFYGGIRTCRKARENLSTQGGNLCPSYYLLEHDSDRIPRDLIQAECSCRRCLPQRRKSSRTLYRESFRLSCAKMYTYTQVLRRAGCIDRIWSYRLFWERISIGCSCNLVID